MGDDFRTEAGVMGYVSHVKGYLRKKFTKTGKLEAGMICLATMKDGQRLPSPIAVMVARADDLNGHRADAIYKRLAREMEAAGVLFYGEGWSVDFENDAEHEAWRGRDWGQHPRAYEFLFLTLEHRVFDHHAWQAVITRDAEGRPEVGEFIEKDKPKSIGGKFSHFLDFPLNQA